MNISEGALDCAFELDPDLAALSASIDDASHNTAAFNPVAFDSAVVDPSLLQLSKSDYWFSNPDTNYADEVGQKLHLDDDLALRCPDLGIFLSDTSPELSPLASSPIDCNLAPGILVDDEDEAFPGIHALGDFLCAQSCSSQGLAPTTLHEANTPSPQGAYIESTSASSTECHEHTVDPKLLGQKAIAPVENGKRKPFTFNRDNEPHTFRFCLEDPSSFENELAKTFSEDANFGVIAKEVEILFDKNLLLRDHTLLPVGFAGFSGSHGSRESSPAKNRSRGEGKSDTKYRVLVASDSWRSDVAKHLTIPDSVDKTTRISSVATDAASVKPGKRASRGRPRHLKKNVSEIPDCGVFSAGPISGEKLLSALLDEIKSGVTTSGDNFESAVDVVIAEDPFYMSKIGITGAKSVPGGHILHPDLMKLCDKWTSTRAVTDAYFRLDDPKCQTISLDEMKNVISIVTSRPPRRINHYPAPVFDGKKLLIPGTDELPWGLCSTASLRRTLSKEPAELKNGDKQNPFEPCYNASNPNLYRPRYLSGLSRSKRAWCDNCSEGGFYFLKTSAYLYHKTFEHGIYSTCNIMEDPLVVVRDGRAHQDRPRWKGLCGTCYRWIEIHSKGDFKWTTWFRHYNSCQKEYAQMRALLRFTGAGLKMVELEYCPYVLNE